MRSPLAGLWVPVITPLRLDESVDAPMTPASGAAVDALLAATGAAGPQRTEEET
jgi:hypothetical protein